jgi:hypothetical protein
VVVAESTKGAWSGERKMNPLHLCGWHIRVILKVRKRQHQNPEFGCKRGEKPAKKYISIKGGDTQKTINFGGKLSFICLLLLCDRLDCCYVLYDWSYMYRYYNYSRTLCIKCWLLALPLSLFVFGGIQRISYPDFIKFPYFANETERGVWVWKEAQRQGENRVTFWISLRGIRKI